MSAVALRTRGLAQLQSRLDLGFLRSSAVVGAAHISARVLGILFSFAVAKFYSPVQFGEVRYLMALSAVLVIPTLALPRTLSRFVSMHRPAGQRKADRYYSNTMVLIGISMATVLIAAVVAMLVVHNLDVGIFPLCIGLSLFAIYFDLLRGIERFQAMAVFYVTANVVQLALVLVAALIHIYSVTLVVTAFGLSCVPPLLAIELQRRSPIHFQVRMLSRRILRELTVFSLPVLLAHAAYTAWYAGDLLVVQHFLGMAAGANYALTKTITLIFIFVPYATTTAVLPRFVHAETRNGGAYLRAMLFATAVTSLCLLLVLALAGNIMLHFAFHHKYADASLTLLPVSLGMALYSLYIVLESWVVSRGRPVVHAIAMTIMAVVTLGGDAILVPMYGPKGAGEGFVLGAAAGLVTIGAAAPLTRSRQKRTAVSSIDATTVAVEPQPSSPVEEESPPKDVSSVKTSSARGFPARRTIAHVMSQECGAEITESWTILGTPRKENGSSAVSVRCTPRHPGRRRRGLRRSAVADHVE